MDPNHRLGNSRRQWNRENSVAGDRRDCRGNSVTFSSSRRIRSASRPVRRSRQAMSPRPQRLYTAISSGVLTAPRPSEVGPGKDAASERGALRHRDPHLPGGRVRPLRIRRAGRRHRVRQARRTARLRGGLGDRLPDPHPGERGARVGTPVLVRADDHPGLRSGGDPPDPARHRDHHPPLPRPRDPRQAGGDARPAVEGPVPAWTRPRGVAGGVPGGGGVARARASGQHGGGVHRGPAAVARP